MQKNDNMKYLPFENITYHTQLPKSEVIKRLNENLEPRELFSIGFNRNQKEYKGDIYRIGFNINKVANYSLNLFNPIIIGELNESKNGTIVKVKMRLHVLVGIFTILWFSGAFIGLFNSLIMMPLSKISFFILIPVLILIFGYALTLGAFKYESKRSKKHLAELFEAEIEAS